MKTEDFLKTFEGMKFKENLMTYTIIIQSVVALVLLLALINKPTIAVLYPSTLTQKAEVSEDWGSVAYKESWALFMSQALGNVTPESLKFIKNRIDPLLSPRVYQTVAKALEQQVAEIRDSHVTLYFEPRHVTREETTGKIFVNGQSVMEATTGQRERDERTYEFKMEVVNWMISFTHISTYEGPPRTQEYIAQQKAKAEK